MPFLLVAILGVVAATAMVLTTRDPERGRVEAALQATFQAGDGFQYDERLTWPKLAHIMRIPTNSFVILQAREPLSI